MQKGSVQLLKTEAAPLAIVISLMLLIISHNSYAEGMIINEIMYDLEGSDTNGEWVELYNNSESAGVNLLGWKFFDGDGTTQHSLTIYQGTWTIPPQRYAVIVKNGATFTDSYGTNTGTIIQCTAMALVNSTATIALINTNNESVCSANYSSVDGGNGNGKSLERISQISNEWAESQIAGGTPGKRNSVATIETGTIATMVRISPVSGRARVEGTYTVEIRIENVVNLYGWQCSLGFNPAILQPIVIEEGGFLKDTGTQTLWRSPNIATGSLKNIACSRLSTSTAISGSGILASIKFKVIGTSTKMPSSLELGNIILSDPDGALIPHDLLNGSVSVAYGFNINMDTTVNIQDLVLVGRQFGMSSGDTGYDPWCDINSDGTIDIFDIADISRNFSDVPNIVVSQAPKTSCTINDKSADIRLAAVSTTIKVGEEIDVGLWIDNATNLYGIQFDIETDNPDSLKLIGVKEGEFLKKGQKTFWATSPAINKFAQCRMGRVKGENGQGVIAVLRVKANKEGTATITVRDVLGVSPDIERISVNPTNISLHIVPLEGNLSTLTHTAYPNPSLNSQPIRFETSGQIAMIEIYTLSGELIKTITNSNIGEWDLTNMDNKPVASGIYFYILKTTNDKILQGKVGVIK